MEAKHMAMSIATQEIMWLCILLSKLGFPHDMATPLQTNNQLAIDLANYLAFHGWSKHIDIQHHFIQECVASNEVMVWHCASEAKAADMKSVTQSMTLGIAYISRYDSRVEGEC